MSNYSALCSQCCLAGACKFHWFEKNYCNVNCLKKYYSELIVKCCECEAPLSFQKIHIVGTPYQDLIFCNLDCETQYKKRHVLCTCCSIEMDIEPSLKSQRSTAFCSPKCEELLKIHSGVKSLPQAKCSQCRELRDVRFGVILSNIKFVACSEGCFNELRKNTIGKQEVCLQCLYPFENEDNTAFVIAENEVHSAVCSAACLVFFMSHNEKTADCSTCGTSGKYFQMIRDSSFENHVWCSLECLMTKSHLLNEPTKDQLSGTSILMDGFSRDCDENNNASHSADETLGLTRCKVKPLTEIEKEKLIKRRASNCTHICSSCDSTIVTNTALYRWHMMEFCSGCCLDNLIMANEGQKCWSCENSISISNLFVHTKYVENDLRHFCSTECISIYLDYVQGCKFCQKIMSGATDNYNKSSGFCSKQCKESFERISSNEPTCEEKFCTDCDKMKPVKLNMVYNGELYPFCSFACFFFVKSSCRIYADSCTLCKNYFVQNSDESFKSFDGLKINLFCSNICRSLFIQKYQQMVSCSFCEERNLDTDMLQLISGDGSEVRCFCSKSCAELFIEISPGLMATEQCDLKESQQADTQTVGTQTDDTYSKCTCDANNGTQILVPIKRVANDVYDSRSLCDQSNIRPGKVSRRT